MFLLVFTDDISRHAAVKHYAQ